MKTPAYLRSLVTVCALCLVCGCDQGSTSNLSPDAPGGSTGATAGAASGTAAGSSASGASSAASAGSSAGGGASAGFVHPGAWQSQAQLDFVKAKIAAGAEPWKTEFERIKSSPSASRGPNLVAMLDSKNDTDANTSRDDALGAYTLALLWAYSGDEAYAKQAIGILNAWASFQAFTSRTDQDKLQAGWIGAVFAPAAEIMRAYPGWSEGDIAKLQAMFKTVFYPQLNTASSWNGNVDLTQIDAMLSIAVFNDDRAEFDAAIERWHARTPAYFYLTADGPKPPAIAGDHGSAQVFWGNPSKWVDGLTQETCRDNGHHAQFALGSAMHAAEVAWNQGVDLYTADAARYTAALELLATQLLSGTMQGTCANDVASADRFDTWEVAYNHYHHRQGLALPKTAELIMTQIRPSASRADWNLVYETLTHAAE
jgi:hypothetical protein